MIDGKLVVCCGLFLTIVCIDQRRNGNASMVVEAVLDQHKAKQNSSSISDEFLRLMRNAALPDIQQARAGDNHINESKLWSRAYIVKLENSPFQWAVGQVFFRESDWLKENKKRKECTVKGVAANKVRLINAGNKEDRSSYHTYRVECLFVGARLKLEASESVMVTFNQETVNSTVPNTQRKGEGLSLCIPTFHSYDIMNSHVLKWLEHFLAYYERTHNLKRMHIYTDKLKYKRTLDSFSTYRDSHPSCAIHQCASLEATFISKTNVKSWYHNQRLAIFDCMYKSFGGCYEWVVFQDLDEVLAAPSMVRGWTWSLIPNQVQGFTLGSWPFDGRHGIYRGENCQCPEKPNMLQKPKEKVRSTKTNCLRCIIGSKGRRKYAIRAHFFSRIRPRLIHLLAKDGDEQVQGKHVDVSAASGLHLRHLADFPKLMDGSTTMQHYTVQPTHKVGFTQTPPFHFNTFVSPFPCYQKFERFAQLLC